MTSTFSRPASFRLSATNPAARSMSPRCSGSVLMLGILRNVFNSSRKRSWLSRTNASVALDMSSINYYTSWSNHAGGFGAGLMGHGAGEDAPHLRSAEWLRQQIVGAQVNRRGPEPGVRPSVGHNEFPAQTPG